MLVTLFGMVIEVSPVQPENAEEPMLVTLAGIVTEVSFVQFEKAEAGILVPPLIMTVVWQNGTSRTM